MSEHWDNPLTEKEKTLLANGFCILCKGGIYDKAGNLYCENEIDGVNDCPFWISQARAIDQLGLKKNPWAIPLPRLRKSL